uniref:DDE Tnp4 domain-containing protein n=1 Tax=Chenopodium quinoa TaxID=63459 RepID=A0A803N5E2_CHEQI
MMGAHFYRSGETISRQFHACLLAILKLHVVLLKKPTPIREDCDDERWKYFKNCLGALDGTMILVNVPCDDRPKYRTRKGTIAMNVLGVCSPEMEFTYVLPGWEGSAHDCRILRDAISRPNGLKVPKAEGFADAVNNLEKVAPPQVTLDSSDDEDVLGSGNVTQTVTSPPYKKIKTENTTKKSKRGSGGAGSSNELASLQAFMKDMNVHLSTMATVMARTDDREQRADEREQKLVEKSEQVLEELLSFNLEGVTPTQVFEVANILTAQPNKLMIFSKCPDVLKGAYVKSLLGGSGDGSA